MSFAGTLGLRTMIPWLFAMVAAATDGGVTPFKGQKGEAWDGGYRGPLVVRWPGIRFDNPIQLPQWLHWAVEVQQRNRG